MGAETTTFSMWKNCLGLPWVAKKIMQPHHRLKRLFYISTSCAFPVRANCFVTVALLTIKFRGASKHPGFERIQRHVSQNGIVSLKCLWYDKTIHLYNVLQWDSYTVFLIC